jgi:hypothetical protein
MGATLPQKGHRGTITRKAVVEFISGIVKGREAIVKEIYGAMEADAKVAASDAPLRPAQRRHLASHLR